MWFKPIGITFIAAYYCVVKHALVTTKHIGSFHLLTCEQADVSHFYLSKQGRYINVLWVYYTLLGLYIDQLRFCIVGLPLVV